MESSRTGREIQQQDLARFGQELHGGAGAPSRICGSPTAGTRLASPKLHPAAQNEPEIKKLAAKKSQERTASREKHLSSGIPVDLDDSVNREFRRLRDEPNRGV
jgi:hypothetical protein